VKLLYLAALNKFMIYLIFTPFIVATQTNRQTI